MQKRSMCAAATAVVPPRMAQAASLSLVELPHSCLLRVLQCCAADDQRSLFSAARAHSRLHQLAVEALQRVTAQVSQQQQLHGVMAYLGQHGQDVDTLDLTGCWSEEGDRVLKVSLRQLPPQMQLSSLQFDKLRLQLQPENGAQGVLGSAAAPTAAVKQLRLRCCEVIDDWAALLPQLPAGLEHLSIVDLMGASWNFIFVPTGMLQQLQHLTYLELGSIQTVGPDEARRGLQALQSLTQLVDFRLFNIMGTVTPSLLSGMQHLTRLHLSEKLWVKPGALAGRTQLQHLRVSECHLWGAAGVAQLLSNLQPMQQLLNLTLSRCLLADHEGNAFPASAYAALTASSKLQHLDISHCRLLPGVWQHLFPTGRQLSNLRSLNVSGVLQASDGAASLYHPAPEGSSLVSCCPGLQSLKMWSLQCSAELLAPLTGLSGLHTLECELGDATADVVQAVCRLTGLRELTVQGNGPMQQGGSLLHLTQLQQLTRLGYQGAGMPSNNINLSGEAVLHNRWVVSLLVYHIRWLLPQQCLQPTALGWLCALLQHVPYFSFQTRVHCYCHGSQGPLCAESHQVPGMYATQTAVVCMLQSLG